MVHSTSQRQSRPQTPAYMSPVLVLPANCDPRWVIRREAPKAKRRRDVTRRTHSLPDHEGRCGRRSLRNRRRSSRPTRALWRSCVRDRRTRYRGASGSSRSSRRSRVAKSNVMPGARSATTPNCSQTTSSPPRRVCQNVATRVGFAHVTTIADTNTRGAAELLSFM